MHYPVAAGCRRLGDAWPLGRIAKAGLSVVCDLFVRGMKPDWYYGQS